MNSVSDSTTLTVVVKQEAYRLGFDFVRAVAIADAPHADFFDGWIAAGRAGDMTYLTRHADRRRFPARLADGGRPFHSMIVLAVDYRQFTPDPAVLADPARGIIASYAWGDDYHELIRPLLHQLDAFIATRSGRTSRGKCLVDTGPVLERDWAQQAGMGFTGKNCCTIRPGAGSWLLLATVMVPEVLTPDPPPRAIEPVEPPAEAVLAGLPPQENYGRWQFDAAAEDSLQEGEVDIGASRTVTGTCGRCTRCLDACPTGAFVGPFHLDPARCISYWTIEAQGIVPRELRSGFGNRIFGCDICQEVCPWNLHLPERTPRLAGLAAQAGRVAPRLLEGFDPALPYWLEQEAFSRRFRRSPVKRAKRPGMLRNVCIALGNWADPAALAPLSTALAEPEPVVRIHAAWALGEIRRRHGHEPAQQRLQTALENETDERVRAEVRHALYAG